MNHQQAMNTQKTLGRIAYEALTGCDSEPLCPEIWDRVAKAVLEAAKLSGVDVLGACAGYDMGSIESGTMVAEHLNSILSSRSTTNQTGGENMDDLPIGTPIQPPAKESEPRGGEDWQLVLAGDTWMEGDEVLWGTPYKWMPVAHELIGVEVDGTLLGRRKRPIPQPSEEWEELLGEEARRAGWNRLECEYFWESGQRWREINYGGSKDFLVGERYRRRKPVASEVQSLREEVGRLRLESTNLRVELDVVERQLSEAKAELALHQWHEITADPASLPTKEDADEYGDVLWVFDDRKSSKASFDKKGIGLLWKDRVTHWRHTNLPKPKPKTEDAFTKWWKDHLTELESDEDEAKTIWNAALQSQREQKS